MAKLWQATKDWWQLALAIGGALMSAVNIAYQLYTTGNFQPNFIIGIGAILFFILGPWEFIKAIRKSRESHPKIPPSTQNEIKGEGIVAKTVSDSPIVKADRGGKAAGHDLVEHHYYGDKPKTIEDDNLQIRIKIHSNEYNRYTGRILHLTIYNESSGNIEDCEVILKDAKNEDNNLWKLHRQGSVFNWSDKHQLRTSRMLVIAGGYAEADMIKTDPKSSPHIIFQIPIQGLPTAGGAGHYRIDTMISGVYARKRFEIPLSLKFNYISGQKFSDIEFVNPDNFPLQIVSASIEYNQEVIYEFKR